MLDEHLIRDFRTRRFGWLSPDGHLIPCESFDHLSVLGREDRYEEFYQQAIDEMDRELESLDPGEHPAMHRFDCSGDARRAVMDEAYEDGWVRLGMWHCGVDRMEAVSKFNTLQRHIDSLKLIAQLIDCDLVCRDEQGRSLGQKQCARLGLRHSRGHSK